MDRRLGAPVIVADLMIHLECLSTLESLPATPRTKELLACHAAGVASDTEVCSRAAEEVQCMEALERAAVLLDSGTAGETPIPAISHFDLSHLARWNGQCLAQLGRGAQAQIILEEAIAAVDGSFVRARSGMTLDLAISYFRQSGLEPACDMAGRALTLARQTQSVRHEHRVIVFRSQLEPWADSWAVQQLDKQLQYLL